MIQLKKTTARTYSGHARYEVIYDHAAGRDNRYTVLLMNAADPITIGRELDLATCVSIISDHEAIFGAVGMFTGDHDDAMRVHEIVTNARRTSTRAQLFKTRAARRKRKAL